LRRVAKAPCTPLLETAVLMFQFYGITRTAAR
jgi:hypothetical protein